MRGSSCLRTPLYPKAKDQPQQLRHLLAVELDLIPTAKLLFNRNDLQLIPFPLCKRLGPTAPCWQPQTGYYTPRPSCRGRQGGERASEQSSEVTDGPPATPPVPESTKKVEGHSEPRGHAWSSGWEGDALSLLKTQPPGTVNAPARERSI